MTGKEIIIHYLTRHKSFTIMALLRQYGCSRSLACNAASTMVRRGELSKVKMDNGEVIYYPVCELSFFDEEVDIFERCKNSPVMRRILVVWGVLSPSALER